MDEREARSPWRRRPRTLPIRDACSSLWLDGELVDLVLHDAGADVRAPTHELTIAHDVLRNRRIASQSSA